MRVIVLFLFLFSFSLSGMASAEFKAGDFKFGGMIGFETWYNHTSDKVVLANGDDTDELWANGGQLLGMLLVDYTDPSGTLSAHSMIEFDGYDDGDGQSFRDGERLRITQLYVDWRLNSSFKLRFGQQQGLIGAYNPFEVDGPTELKHVGNFHSNELAAIRLDYITSYNTTWSILFGDPDNSKNEVLYSDDSTSPVFNSKEENMIPRIDLGWEYSKKGMKIGSAVTYLTQHYDNLPDGYEDTINIWGISFGGEISVTPKITIKTEVYYGENLGDGNHNGADGYFNPAADIAPMFSSLSQGGATLCGNDICDTTGYGGFIQVGYVFKKNMSMHVAIGAAKYENDGLSGSSDDTDITDMVYAVAFHYMVLPNLEINPQFRIFNFDDSATIAGVEEDRGQFLELGVCVKLFF